MGILIFLTLLIVALFIVFMIVGGLTIGEGVESIGGSIWNFNITP